MCKKYQIFISSTFEDLKEERQKVVNAILELGHFPVFMETFPAADEDKWEFTRQTIDSTDYYVLIIGRKYGSIIEEGPDRGKSYTQKEFEYAQSRNIPILVFTMASSVKVAEDRQEHDPERIRKLEAFIQTAGSRMGKTWKNGDDLARMVASSLTSEINRNKRPGYIRGSTRTYEPIRRAADHGDKRHEMVTVGTYPNLSSAYNDIIADVNEGSFLDFMGLQGSNFLAESNDLIDAMMDKEGLRIRYLVQYPFSEEVRQRLTSIYKDEPDYKIEEHWRTIYAKVKMLRSECSRLNYPHAESVEMRYVDMPLIHRMVFTENHLYLNYYENGKKSTECQVYRYDAGSPAYETYRSYFEDLWIKAKHSLPIKRIPAKYKFLKDRCYEVTPSLVINICADCDMNCLYCPESKDGGKIGGENLMAIRREDYCKINAVKTLVKKFAEHLIEDNEKPILRITGGEPLFGPDNRNRTKAVLDQAEKSGYSRIVFCTNGLSFIQAYEEDTKLWDSLKGKLLLKISLDTLNEARFRRLTGTHEGSLTKVKKAIEFAAGKGFKIELNVVATRDNLMDLSDIMDLFDFAVNNQLVGIKILTVNDFGGNVAFEQSMEEQTFVSQQLGKLMENLLSQGCEERGAFLNDNKGIRMRRFVHHYDDPRSEQDKECTLTIVDHHNSLLSITPTRTFSEFCRKCEHFPKNARNHAEVKPCSTGVMSLTLRADGLLSPCRLLVDSENAVNISGSSTADIKKRVDDLLRMYDRCWHGVE